MLGVTFLNTICAALCDEAISLIGVTDSDYNTRKGGLGTSNSLGSQLSSWLFFHSIAQENEVHKCGEDALSTAFYSLKPAPSQTGATFRPVYPYSARSNPFLVSAYQSTWI